MTWTVVVLLTALVPGCGTNPSPNDSSTRSRAAAESDKTSPGIAVTSSYLEAVTRDLLGAKTAVLPLVGPGMCPGHFDIRPSQISRLADCRLMLRFDFQQSLETKLAGRIGLSLNVASISLPGGMCVPDSYESACRQVAEHLLAAGDLDRRACDDRLVAIAARMKGLRSWADRQIESAGLRDVPILCSNHQTGFCRWLRLRIVATFSGADTARMSEIDQAVEAGERTGVKLIVANLPEGRRLADALADRLNAQVVVFGNFPKPDDRHAFDNLVRSNVERLLRVPRDE